MTIMSERPAAIDAPSAGVFGDMLRTVEELDTPEGYKAELIRGKIVVSPWSKLRYPVTFGTSLRVPPPFDFDLDTSEFAAGADVES
ncbi:hypothetical protein SAMN05446589_3383 [Streptomyces sp. OV198]|nr:hypothetical protein SAMN05446589_3383 [Streptomyces sp. OV198]